MRLVDLVKIDNRFEKSVNLLLDLYNKEKIKGYIPTRSSVNLLERYFDEVSGFSGGRANILIGPYGKGKSHMLLVLLSILADNESPELDELIKRIEKVNEKVGKKIREIYGKKKFLPVVVNTSSGDLGQALVRSLNQALKREKLDDVVPNSYFSEAVKAIKQWESIYPQTYCEFVTSLGNKSVDDFVSELDHFDYQALEQFRKTYPKLTSGSEFNPVIDESASSIYQSVNRSLVERHGYTGIYVIFDEFSKYIEGHPREGFSADMSVLQDMLELCNKSKEEQLHFTCVAHKAIRSYGNSLAKEVKNAFRGVEGRLREDQFIVSSHNNYELLADVLIKKEAFHGWIKDNDIYKKMLKDSYLIPELASLFEKNDFNLIIGEGCFPLTPLSSLLLIGLSEKIAQNERTLFTFLTGKDLHCLYSYVMKCRDTQYIGTELIYDYFVPLFETDNGSLIHSEWLKADYALTNLTDENEIKIIKALAVIRMVNKADDVPANDLFLRIACGINEAEYKKALESLLSENIIVYKSGIGAYDFQNGININIDGAVSDCALKYYSNIDSLNVLNDICRQKYILPKKYNQKYAITRYYRVCFIEVDTFLALSSVSYIEDGNHPDGVLFLIENQDNDTENKVMEHLREMQDPRAVVGMIVPLRDCIDNERKLLAVRRLLADEKFIEQNETLTTELKRYEVGLLEELNRKIGEVMLNISRIHTAYVMREIGAFGLNRAVSEICEMTYDKTPIINHELINRHNVSAQISKARNMIIDDLFHSRLMNQYLVGSSAESTIYRATMEHTKDDQNLKLVKSEIISYIHECKGRKVPFSKLIDKLTAAPIGMRRGTLPIYITEQLMELDDTPVVYLGRKEFALDAPLMSNIVSTPENYSLFVQDTIGQKLEYIEGVEKLFEEEGKFCREIEKRNRLYRISCYIQSWYRSLPQISLTFKESDYEGQPIKEIIDFRKLFSGSTNPREVLFDQIPKIFKTDDLFTVLNRIRETKEDIDKHAEIMKKMAEIKVREAMSLSKESNFSLSIKEWYNKLPDMVKNNLFVSDTQRFLNCIRDITSSNPNDFIEIIAKEVTGFFIEDWNDNTLQNFADALERMVGEVESKEMDTESLLDRRSIVSRLIKEVN